MKVLLFGREDVIRPFMEALVDTPGAFSEGRGVGLVDIDEETGTGTLVAGCWYEKWNGVNLHMHIAALPNKRWMSREFLRYCFHYPFVELGCKRVTGYVEASNLEARRFDEHLGFEVEATLKDAAPTGDVLVYVMWKDRCRWLKLKPHNVPKRVEH
jgi:RimJ/RimL family protein N-acetyltransferase